MINNFDQSVIEEAVAGVLRTAGVSANVYYNRPRSSTADLADFVVCKVTGAIDDRYAFGQFTLSVNLFARDVNNMKNAKKLSVMQTKCINSMPRVLGDMLIDSTPRIIGDTDDGEGYCVRIINYKVTIKSTPQ